MAFAPCRVYSGVMKYAVLNLPSRRLGGTFCGDLTPAPAAKTAITAVQATWSPIKSWKTALDTNQMNLLAVFSNADAAEFAELYASVLTNEAPLQAVLTRISQPWTDTYGCLTAEESALFNAVSTKVERLKVLMGKARATGTGTPGQVVVIWGGGPGQPFQQGQQGVQPQQVPIQGQAPATTTPASSTAADDAKKKETTKNLLIGGGILAALGTGIWALARK